MPSINETDHQIIADMEGAAERLGQARAAIGRIIFGQDEVVEQVLIAILGGGHALLVGAPGLAKTKLATTLGRVLGLDEKRVQFTPDLMPADILGSEVLDESEGGRRQFRFVPGPVFCQLMMADEINRASPRTQSALLQAMQEHHITVAGVRHDLPRPFHVLATQNPIEQEGTYPLPEAQLDRFLVQIDVPYPSLDAERRMLFATTGAAEEQPEKVLSTTELMNAQRLTRLIPVGEQVAEAILRVVRAGATCAPRELAEWRGVRMIGDGHSMDYPRSDSGAYKGEALYLREDGSWVRLVYEGTWSRWQGSTSEWTARVEPLTVLEVAQEWSLHSLLETLRDALARAAKGDSKRNAESARARTARVEALLNLL